MYEAGIAVAFCMWVYLTAMIVVRANSRLARNLRKVGYRQSWATGAPEPMSPKDVARSPLRSIAKFVLIGLIGLPFTLLSWLYVALVVAQFIYARAKDFGAPPVVKEYRWKLRNLDLSTDDIVRQMMKVQGLPDSDFDKVRLEVASGSRAAV